MIKFYDQVPQIYSNASRDFQYLGWLISIVLNAVKHNADDLYDLPNSKVDPKLTELLALTLGFKVRRNYDKDQLNALVSVLPVLLKYKGTKYAIETAGETLLKASGAIGLFSCDITGNQVTATFPEELVDITLFNDLMPYILPAGMCCRTIRKTAIPGKADTVEISYADAIIYEVSDTVSGNRINLDQSELFTLFMPDPDGNTLALTSFSPPKSENDTKSNITAGLLANTVIPPLVPDNNSDTSES